MLLWSQSQSSFMNEPAEAANPALPLFYKRVAVVDEAKLSNSSLKEQIGYDFARDTAIVPLIVTELFTAASTYPIVFITEPVPSVLAVLGLRQAQNLFVSGDGSKWDAPYVPAYVRRYPFVFLRHDNDDLTLCIDEAANALEPGRARPLFEDGKRTPLIERALQFCIEFQRGHLATEAFMKALIERDLLVPYQITSTSRLRAKNSRRPASRSSMRLASQNYPTTSSCIGTGKVGLDSSTLISPPPDAGRNSSGG